MAVALPGAIGAGGPAVAAPAATAPRFPDGQVPVTTTTSTPPPTAPPSPLAMPPSKAYVLVDLETGNVLAGYNERERLRPASLTKLLTALIAVTYLPTNATVPGTKQSLAAYPDTVGIEKGVPWPLEEVLQSLLVMSANDAAYALAQKISGSLSAFGSVMDRAAAQIGMSDDPVFHDPAGLDGSEGVDGGNFVSARDLAIAGRDLLRVPRLAAIVKELSYSFVDPTGQAHYLQSTNYTFLESEQGAIGVKTGFTDRAGSCVMGAATQHGRTMLAVVMDGYNPTQTAIDLLNQGFATPVAKETAADRLPPFALPSPPGPTRRSASAGKRRAALIPDHHAATSRRGPTPAGARPGAQTTRHFTTTAQGGVTPASVNKRGGRAGLAAVAGSMAGTLLILAAASAGLVAVVEYSRLRRLRRSQSLTPRSTRWSTTWVTTLGGNRRHRDELVASYSRHERGTSRWPRSAR